MRQTKHKLGKYELKFSKRDWEELTALMFEPFVFDEGAALTRSQWCALGDMCIGKATRLEHDRSMSIVTRRTDLAWAAHLRRISDVIFTCFRPGDLKL